MPNKTTESNGRKSSKSTSEKSKSARATSSSALPTASKSKPNETTVRETKLTASRTIASNSTAAATLLAKQNATQTPSEEVDELGPDTLTTNIKSPSFTISLYALRYLSNFEKLKLQAIFGTKCVQDFKEIGSLSSDGRQDLIPIVFQLAVDVQTDDDNVPYIVTKKARYRCSEYHLRIEKSAGLFGSSKYDQDVRRSISNNTSLHQFLLDLHFSKSLINSAPGANVSILDQLCFFTYFIIHDRRFDLFPTLMNQFANIIHSQDFEMQKNSFIVFVETANKYLKYIDSVLDEPVSMRTMLRMFGILPIKRKDLPVDNPDVRLFVVKILGRISRNLPATFLKVDSTEWLLFKDGLILLILIDILSININHESDSIGLISRFVNARKQQEEIVDSLFRQLMELRQPIRGSNWIDLLSLISDNKLTCDYLNLSSSLNTFLKCSLIILRRFKDDTTVQTRIKQIFDEMVSYNILRFQLNDIVMLLKLLQSPPPTDKNEKDVTAIIFLMIETSQALQNKIKTYLSRSVFQDTDLQLLYELFQYHNPILLIDLDKQTYLREILHKNQRRSCDFYTNWFEYFICDIHYIETEYEWSYFQTLLHDWSDQIIQDRILFREIMNKMDNLLERLAQVVDNKLNSRRFTYFIKHIVDKCLKQGSISNSIIIVGTHVKNETFLQVFEKKFKENHVLPYMDQLKIIETMHNPLLLLIDLYQRKEAIQLVQRLLQMCCDLIKIEREELLRHTFETPSHTTFIYFILFENCFMNISIRKNILDQLTQFWNDWEENGLKVHQIKRWQNFTGDEKYYFIKIWDLVGKYAKKNYLVDRLFDKQYQEMLQKIKMKEKIGTCINAYCLESSDKQHYIILLDRMQEQIDVSTVQMIVVPHELEKLVPFTERLSHISKSNAWMKFYTSQHNSKHNVEHTMNAERNDDQNDNETFNIDALFNIDEVTTSTNKTTHRAASKKNVRRSTNQQTKTSTKKLDDQKDDKIKSACTEILLDANQILDDFIQELNTICLNWKELSIEKLLSFFSNVESVETDMVILKEFLHPDIIPKLLFVFKFWKNQEYLRHICLGFNELLERYNISSHINLKTIFSDILEINKQSISGICYDKYQQYEQSVENIYSTNILNLCAELYVSKELIKFLDELTTSDADNLLEAVNDWDETLLSTKSVIDFVRLKTFFTRIYTSLEQLREPNIELLFENVVKCFDEIFMDHDFKNILTLFQTCALSIAGMKHLYLELTNKEQSKRRCIMDIMSHSLLSFVQNSRSERIFNVEIKSKNLTFDDFSELRDRARLIEYSNKHKNDVDHNLEIKQIESFVEFVGIIETVLENLLILYTAGCPIVTEIIKNQRIICNQSNYDELRQLHTTLKEKLDLWEKHLCNMYKIYPELTHLSFEQFQIVENFFYNEDADEKHPGYHLLKYIGFEPALLQRKELPKKGLNENDCLENLGKILRTQRSFPDETEETKKHFKINNVELIETNDEGILRAAFSLFDTIKKPIHVHQLFYCTKRTTLVEIRAFIYRCFFSKKYQLLIRPDVLPLLIQDKFFPLFIQLMDENPTCSFHLGIITTKSASHIQLINAIKTRFNVNILRDQELLSKDAMTSQIQNILHHCTIVTSRLSGLGKSRFIKNESERLDKQLIKFPIAGNIKADEIADRLRMINSHSLHASILHLDIGHVDMVHDLDELLYCLILFRSFCFGQLAIYLPMETSIYIELPSSPFINVNEHLALCEYLKPIYLDGINWNDLDCNRPMIQFVAKYLNAIDSGAIVKRNINLEDKEIINRELCLKLIRTHFLRDKNLDFITWTQLSIFISVFYSLFNGFSICGYFLVDFVNESQLRLDILQALLHSSDQFTSVSVEMVRKQQRTSLMDNPETGQPVLTNSIVRWETTQPFTLVFTATHDPLFVYKTVDDVPKSLRNCFNDFQQIASKHRPQKVNTTLSALNYTNESVLPDYNKLEHVEFFQKLASLSRKYFNKAVCIKCFKQYPYETQQCTECGINDSIHKPTSLDTNDILVFQTKIATILEAEYVLTPDNYIKMLLIYMRIQSELPVLIMGETGCGKTALIKFLCQKILDDQLEIFRIHAGIANEKIIETMLQFIVKAKECATEKKRLWVFFDEFNTTSSIDLLKEITCERTLLGEDLPSNMVFLGACNPRRHKSSDEWMSYENNIGIKKDRYEMMKKLVGNKWLTYTVVPIPETMLEYIWDYGYLDQDTERAYIRTMLKTCASLVMYEQLSNGFVQLISRSQLFIREIEDVSSVSLRDVARFCRLYNWFHESITIRSVDTSLPGLKIARRSAFAALFLCYYFRLPSVVLKNNYVDMLEQTLAESSSFNLVEKRFLIKQLEDEEEELINQMELPKGTAKNRALRENIFVLLVCVVNRIPVVLCGKPGCSKTSAVQILISNLNGKKSNNTYFRTLPELITVSYQGSQNCTSSSIEKVFERAGKYQKAQSDASFLPVIVFDEIGLAELSPHNPLKVLHAELEVETCQYGFVGISNWRLDASKMNRVLYISCPDPDLSDLKITAQSIADDILRGQIAAPDLKLILDGLAEAYYELFNFLDTQQENEHYFGLRDFYSLVKGVLSETYSHANENHSDLFAIVHRQIKINFDGIIDGSTLMWEAFCKSLNHTELIDQYPWASFRDLLNRRIDTHTGRFLMIIGERESLYDYVERYLRSITKWLPTHRQPIRTLIGSQMPGDLVSNKTYTETYSYRVLMDIILHVETNVTLLMRQLGHLHDNLYDLFNQNYAISAKKQYCRIALGALYHPRCLVNDEFFCIVFVNRDEVEKCDPPFLNRFEKHIIDMKDLVQPIHWQITEILLNWLHDLLPSDDNIRFLTLQHLFIGYNPDYVCNLVIDTSEEYNLDENMNQQQVIEACKTKILCCSSFDLPLALAIKSINNEKYLKLIEQYYDNHERKSFADVLHRHRGKRLHSMSKSTPFDAILCSVTKKHIIYTYTQIYDTIKYDETLINEIKLNNLQTELEVINKVKAHFFKIDGARILIIRVDYLTEYKQLLSLKHILLNTIDNESQEPSNNCVWLVIHLQRNMLSEVKNDVLFNGWLVNMIDDLNAYNPITIETLMNPSYYDLITQKPFELSDHLFDELVHRTLSKFRYQVSNNQLETKINQRRNNIIKCLMQDSRSNLRISIRENLLLLMQTIRHGRVDERFSDWRKDVLINGLIVATCRSVNDAIKATISQFYETYFLLLFAHFERNALFDSYQFIQEQNENEQDLLKQIWNNCLVLSLKNIDQNAMNCDHIEIPLVFNLRLPCAMDEYAVGRRISKMLLQHQQLESDISVGDLDHQLWQKLIDKSIYGNVLINNIFDDDRLFEHYYHDQLCFFLNENNIQLTTNFVLQMTRTNPTRSNKRRFQSLLTNSEEMIQIFRIFELGISLVDEQILLNTCKKQFIQSHEERIPLKRNNQLYTLILYQENFYQVEPRKRDLQLKPYLNDNLDIFIENSLMNLLEMLPKKTYVRKDVPFKNIISTHNLIYHGVRALTNYSVNNLEKFISYTSPVRSIIALVDELSATDIINRIYADDLSAKFDSCDLIHTFIEELKNIIEAAEGHQLVDKATVQRTFLKLEIELLKNWLIDHGDQYCDVLTLINRNDTDLWRYSAKIFLYINRHLKLLDNIQEHHGQIPMNDENFMELENFLQKTSNQSYKIHLLLINHLHMSLISSINESDFEDTLKIEYQFLKRNMNELIHYIPNGGHQVQFIGLITWLKCYAQIYAFVLHNDSHKDFMLDIDRFLSANENSFCNTIKLFILKQLVHVSKNVTLADVRETFAHRNVVWLQPLLKRVEPISVTHDLILPLPLFEGHTEYLTVNDILHNFGNINEVITLVKKCQGDQKLAFAFYSWFIQYYCRYFIANTQIDQQFIQIFCTDLKQLLITSFEPIGYNLLVTLCKNFPVDSYFYIYADMPKKELYKRLIALDIFALSLSTKNCPQKTYLSTLLFDRNQRMPQNYANHIQSICLMGMISGDPVITQMIDVRTQIQNRLNTNQIHRDAMFVFQCSRVCHWMFYFENCGIPNDSNQCPLCKKPIGAHQYNQLIQRDPPQIRLNLQDGFNTIEQYIKAHNSVLRLGYHNIASTMEMAPDEKPDHLNRTITFRFLHMWSHAQLLLLYELKYISNNDLIQILNISNISHFSQHFDRDCVLMEGLSTDSEQYHIWLYKIINHMLDNNLNIGGILDTNEKVVQIEQLIERQLIFPHIDSIMNEIGNYRLAYVNLVQKFDKEISLTNYIFELSQNDERYPLLSYFNVNRILTDNPLNDFRIKLQNLPYADRMYPLSTFLLKRLDEYANIQCLYPIMEFTKYIINKYNHRIQRNTAVTMTIDDILQKDDLDKQNLSILLEQFIDAWYKINLRNVRHGCQTREFIRQHPREEFASKTSLACILLNKSKDDSSLLLTACIHTLADMQNDIVGYFRKVIVNQTESNTRVFLNAIRPEHILRLDEMEINNKLVKDSFVINYGYGQGRDIIFDYEEVEMEMRKLVSNLCIFDTDSIPMLNYQFELYNENNSLITNIRRRINQQPLSTLDRTKFQKLIARMKPDEIIHCLGSLDHVFTYLCHTDDVSDISIQAFVEQHINPNVCLNEHIFRRPPFSTIPLIHIISFYELIEEVAFDNVLRNHFKTKLSEAVLDEKGKTKFINQTFGKQNISPLLKSPLVWIAVLKRLLIRVLNANIDLDMPLQIYIERIDLWSSDISEFDLQTFELDEDILLKHTYFILHYIEEKASIKNGPITIAGNEQLTTSSITTDNQAQISNIKTWYSATNYSAKKVTLVKPSAQKLRV